MLMKKENVDVQASEEVSYDSLVRAKSLNQNREDFYLRELCSVIDEVSKRLGKKDLSVLEIGYSDGKRIKGLSEIYKDVKFVGLEVREKPVQDMKDLGYDCRLVDTEIFDEFFKDGEKFDIIFGFAILHHLNDPYKSLESIINLLNPGGVVTFIREGHPLEIFGSYILTTILGNWQYEKNMFKMRKRKFKKLLRKFTDDYWVKYDNNGFTPCFRRLNAVYCALKLDRVAFLNGLSLYARIDSQPNGGDPL